MFDFAWSHFALLFVVAVILLGPQELPTVLRFIGRWTGKIRQHTTEFREYFEAISQEATPPSTLMETKKSPLKPEDTQQPQ